VGDLVHDLGLEGGGWDGMGLCWDGMGWAGTG
jgi:hypothetical protein